MRIRSLTLIVVLAGSAATLLYSRSSSDHRTLITPSKSGLELESIDRSADACVDFYEFACGGWIKQHPLSPDLTISSRSHEMRERTFAVLSRILATPGNDPERKKASDYYASCMDEPAIDVRGIAALQPVLSRIDRLNARDEIPALLAFLHSVAGQPEIAQRQPAYSALFDFSSEHDVPRQIASINTSGTSLPFYQLYLLRDQRSTSFRALFAEHVRQVFTMLGISPDEAAAGARAVLGIETLLASEAANIGLADARSMSLVDVQTMTPHFSWKAYLSAVSAPSISTIKVAQPAFLRAVDSIVADVPITDLKRYLKWQVVHGSMLMLPSGFRQTDFDFFRRALRGELVLEPRSRLCMIETDNRFGDVLGKAFVEETFPLQSKNDVMMMSRAIRTAMAMEIDTASWISTETKTVAKAKLAAIVERIGYPNRWRNYSSLEIRKNDALGNFQRALIFNRMGDLQKIGREVDPDEWPGVTPSSDVSGYRVDLNEIFFPAGFLQPPFYSAGRDAAVNYGAIGSVIGHEITHGFDDDGRRFDSHGNSSNWWTDADANAFQQRAECLVDQYSQYGVAGGAKVNGKQTLGENIADNGGIRLALMAYLAGPGAQSPLTLDGFTPVQRVFLGWAQSSCEHVTPEAESQRSPTSSHAPNRYRVNGTLSNMPEFQAAFSCKADTPMVRKNVCRVW